MGWIVIASNTRGPYFAEITQTGADTPPVQRRGARNRDVMMALESAVAGSEHRGIDVRSQLVVVDQDPDTRPWWGPIGEDIETEVKRAVLCCVVVGRVVWNRETDGALTVARFDDSTEAAA